MRRRREERDRPSTYVNPWAVPNGNGGGGGDDGGNGGDDDDGTATHDAFGNKRKGVGEASGRWKGNNRKERFD